MPLQNIASVANAGTLIAFIAVAVCMMVHAQDSPAASAHVQSDGATWIIGIVAVDRLHLPVLEPAARTMVSVLIWNVVGLAIYLLWARHEPAGAGGEIGAGREKGETQRRSMNDQARADSAVRMLHC